MTMVEKQAGLREIYRAFEAESREFRREAVCRTGCAFCCTRVGNVDTTTLEGLVIREKLRTQPRPVRKQVARLLEKNRRQKKRQDMVRCPFLLKNNTCRIYADRPFSCRQLYSLEKCGPKGPTVHRRVVEMARRSVEAIQRLDDTGYSGHLSYILAMLDAPRFCDTYLSGAFEPAEVMAFGKAHGIVINQMVSKKG